MELHFLIDNGNKIINTFTNAEHTNDYKNSIERIEKKYNVKILPKIVKGELYKYDIQRYGDTLELTVFESNFTGTFNWEPVYTAKITKGIVGVIENGDMDLDFWAEYFATTYGLSKYNELNTEYFSLTPNPMHIIRTIFPTHLETNVFIFFKNYKLLKKVNEKEYDTNIFRDIPNKKINKNVGKSLDNTKCDKEYRYFAIEHEIKIDNEYFLDITLIIGPVKDGVMDIKEKHRFFLTDGYVYSPTNSDLSLLVHNPVYGIIYDRNFSENHKSLMIEKYRDTKYYYAYILSRHFLPAFEILSKAGLDKIANYVLDSYLADLKDNKMKIGEYKYRTNSLNLYGRNDKEILGFKLNLLRNIPAECYEDYVAKNRNIYDFIDTFRVIVNKNSNLVKYINSKEMYDFILCRIASKTIMKEINYLNKIGLEYKDLYIDYLRTCQYAHRYSGGLCPANLHHEHDVMVNYLNELKQAEKNEVFERVVSSDDYKSLLYEGKTYCILAPREANDLVNESYQLSHCVRGYISAVSNRQTRIYFLRTKQKKAKPLVTLEVKNERFVKQARGKANRHLTYEEEDFVAEWMAEKGLLDDYHPYRF